MNRRLTAIGLVSVSLGLGAGIAVAGCGEDRGSVDVEGDTTGGTVGTTSTTGTTTTDTETETAPAGAADETVKIEEVEFAIKPARVEVDEAGVVEFKISNAGKTTHALEVESDALERETEEIPSGGSATLKVDLPEGTYELYCPIGDHEDRGMKAELVVGSGGSGSDDSGGSGPESGY